MNLRPRPKRERRLKGGERCVVKSWKVMFEGCAKYNHVGIFATAMDALLR
jgi:hypothetical protein